MATVVSSVPTETVGRVIVYTVTLEDNQSSTEAFKYGTIKADVGFDESAMASEIGDRVLSSMISGEEADAIHLMPDGDSLSRCQNAKWTTTKKMAKRLIRHMMREKNPRIVVYLEGLITYIRANYTAAQIATWLDLTTDQVIKMNQRINAILSDTGTVKDQLVVFDTKEEDIEE